MQAKKRYLITHTENNESVSPVAEILNISIDNVKRGISFLATEAIQQDHHILEFPGIGITSASLDEGQVKRLKENSGIVAVEEDIEMHILEMQDYAVATEQQVENSGKGITEAYQRGFQEGRQQILDRLNQASALQSPGSNPVLADPGLLSVQPVPWNIALVKAPGAWARGITGAGIRVGVLDTGIATHLDLNPISGGVSFVPGVVSYNDGNSHGTHCSGIVGARNNSIGVKVLSDAGTGSSSAIISGMDWAVANGLHVVSMSLGGLSGPMVAYAQAIKRLQDRGTVVVMAAGNSFGTAFPWVNSPANSIITGSPNASPIAAVDINKIIASFSSRGGQAALWNQVTVSAPGVNIISTVPGGGYASKSGTSMATPTVAGAVALLKQRFPGISPAAVKLKLMSTAQDLGLAGYDITYGAGLINCDKATL